MKAQERDLRAVGTRENWDIVDVIRVPGFSRDFFTYEEFAQAAAAEGMTDSTADVWTLARARFQHFCRPGWL